MRILPDILEKISFDMIGWLRSLEPEELFKHIKLKDYHGFAKSRFSDDVLTEILASYEITPKDVQVEIVAVFQDLSGQVHTHKSAHAFAIILGNKEYVNGPRNAYAFLDDEWMQVSAGQLIDIPPGTPHTFTVSNGGVVYFLSVQAPPIERDGDLDDYHLLSNQPEPPVKV